MLGYDRTRGLDGIILLFLLGLLFFNSALWDWFASLGVWYFPYVLWLILILFGALLQYLGKYRDI
jgi:hypothetical protein